MTTSPFESDWEAHKTCIGMIENIVSRHGNTKEDDCIFSLEEGKNILTSLCELKDEIEKLKENQRYLYERMQEK